MTKTNIQTGDGKKKKKEEEGERKHSVMYSYTWAIQYVAPW